MIRLNKVTLFYILLYCLQLGLVSCQRYGNPRNQNQNIGQTYSLPVQYVPAQNPINQESLITNPGFTQPRAQSPNYPNVIPNNYPGDVELRSFESAPGQPVIIINNGGNSGNSDNGRGRKEDSNFDIGELFTLLLAVNGGGLLGGHHHHHHPHTEVPVQQAQNDPDPPSYPGFFPGYPNPYFPGYPGMPGMPGFPFSPDGVKDVNSGGVDNASKSTVLNITIVLPSSTSIEVTKKELEILAEKEENSEKINKKSKSEKVVEDE